MQTCLGLPQEHCHLSGNTMYSLAECQGPPRLFRDASGLPRVRQAAEDTCAVLWPLCRSERCVPSSNALGPTVQQTRLESVIEPDQGSERAVGHQWCNSQEREKSQRRPGRREHAQLGNQGRVQPGHLRHGQADAVGRCSGMVKVTLLALVSQRFQPLCPRPVMVPFVIIVRSSTFMHPFLPIILPCDPCDAMHTRGEERDISI